MNDGEVIFDSWMSQLGTSMRANMCQGGLGVGGSYSISQVNQYNNKNPKSYEKTKTFSFIRTRKTETSERMQLQLAIAATGLQDAGQPEQANASPFWYHAVLVNATDDTILGTTSKSPFLKTTVLYFQEWILLDDQEHPCVQVTIYRSSSDSPNATNVAVAKQSLNVPLLWSNTYSHTLAMRCSDEEHSCSSTLVAFHAKKQTNGRFLLELRGHDLPQASSGGKWRNSLVPRRLRRSDMDTTGATYDIFNHNGKSMGRSGPPLGTNAQNPFWEERVLDLEDLCGMSLRAPLRITVQQEDTAAVSNGVEPDYIGNVCLSVQDMLDLYSKHDDQGAAVTVPVNDHEKVPLVQGGTQLDNACLSIVQAELLPDKYVSQSVQGILESSLSTLIKLHQLEEMESVCKDSMEAAHTTAVTTRNVATERQARVERLSNQNHEMQTKLRQLHQQAADATALAQQQTMSGSVDLVLAARNLADLDFGIRNHSDPVFEMTLVDSPPHCLVRSNCVRNNLNPTWQRQRLDLKHIASVERTRLKISIFDQDGNNQQEPLGHVVVTVQDLVHASPNEWMDLQDQPERGRRRRLLRSLEKESAMSGQVRVIQADLVDVKVLADESKRLDKECVELRNKIESLGQELEMARNAAEESLAESVNADRVASSAKEDYQAAREATNSLKSSIR